MDGAKFVIAGGGMVAGYAAKQFVELGLRSGDLAILSADTALPYERPPLSKGFLAGKESEDSIRINPPDFYKEHGIEVRLGCVISGVDPGRRQLMLKSGVEFSFEKLILATGATARTLDIPGAQLAGVHYLRSMSDSMAIRQRFGDVKTAVVIGGGFIGMETAAVLAQNGIEVTMVLSEDRIWKKFFSPQMSHFFETYYAGRGIHFVREAKVTAFRGTGSVASAVLMDGRDIACEIAVVGIGASPVTGFLAGSGIEMGDGVVVNEFLESNQAGILAAGDIANYPDLLFGKRRRVEHWDNAVSQGQHCAKALMGERTPFKHVPYFFSDVFDLSYEFWGDSADADEVIHRGDLASNSFSAWWLRQKRLVAAFTMNRPDEERDAAGKWIESKQVLSAAAVADASRPVSSALEESSSGSR